MQDEQLQQLSDNFGRFKRAMQAYISQATSEWGISPAEFEVLRNIYALQPVSGKELAAHMQLTPGAISQLLEGLHRVDAIQHMASEQDRRVKYLSVSVQGERKLNELKAFKTKFLSTALAQVDTKDIDTYLRVQDTLISWLESQGESCETK
jgi:DNA-binding MarR family transcriptional regulator